MASEILRSDASLFEAAAQVWLERAEVAFLVGDSPRASVDRALDLLAHAHLADPDRASAYTLEAYTLLLIHRTRALRTDGDPRERLERVVVAAALAVELDPFTARAWDGLGNAYAARGAGESPGSAESWWARSLYAFARALLIDPDDPWIYNDIGIVHRWRAANLERTGDDPLPEYEHARQCYERAAELDPTYLFAWSNLSELNAAIAAYQDTHGLDPAPALDRAQRAGQRGLEIDPGFYTILRTLAQVAFMQAYHQVTVGEDASAALQRATRYLDQLDSSGAAPHTTHLYRLVTARVEVMARVRAALDPSETLARARAALDQVQREAPSYAYAFLEGALLDLEEARWRQRTGARPVPLAARALARAEKAIELDDSAEAHAIASEICLERARAQHSQTDVEHGLAHADRALALDARYRDAQTARTALLQLRAP